MNNDLEQFSEEYLKELINSSADDLTIELARIALAAKQAKPEYHIVRLEINDAWGRETVLNAYESQLDASKCKDDHGGVIIPCYTTPQPAHTVQDGWIKCSDRLPDDDSFVLVTNGKHTGMGAYLRDDHLEDDERWQDEHFEFINKQSKYPVTHWMSLPPNPEK